MTGKLIVIEGTDGSGKRTQAALLVQRLIRERVEVALISFPQYGKKSAGLVEEYLNGAYGPPDEVNPYAASLFYAVDRFDAARKIRTLLEAGTAVILDRYVDSNAGHQGGKIANDAEREKFLDWLYNTEYGILGAPRPDIVLLLHVPAEIGQRLVAAKQQRLYIESGKSHDSHENNLGHLQRAEAAYLWLAKRHPETHVVIECVENGSLLEPKDIHARVYRALVKARIV